jgi:ATP-dependent exoDNAse (exonuclease V) beta subunit
MMPAGLPTDEVADSETVEPPPTVVLERLLTDEQELSVARRAEPLLLSAGAGSGKTSVLVERFVRAVREDGVAPARILAITFTDRAAGELRERVRARFLELGDREAARDTEAAFVSTFHGFCARLLRAHPLLAELDPAFTILEEGLAQRLRDRAFGAALRELLAREHPEPAVDLLAAYGVDRVHAMIAGIHAQLRSRGQRLPSLPRSTPDEPPQELSEEAVAACSLLNELLGGFSHAYEGLKRERGAVDFDDLELCARELLESQESIRAAWSERFELLMVDEFQDTNPRQLGILIALDRSNLFTVGDEHQSIYGFRHADVSLFRGRRSELARSGASLELTRNFRSREPLLEVVNAVFEPRFGEFAPLRAGRESESPTPGALASRTGPSPAAPEPLTELLLTDRSGWDEDEELAREIATGLPGAPLWRQAEARMLAQRVAELVDSGGARAGEVVVLLRALGDLEVYERALQLRGLRTLAAVGAFWKHQQVLDLLAYLRTLANPLDELALYSTLASPLVGISRDGLALLALAARAERRGAWETALLWTGQEDLGAELAPGDRATLTDFCEWLRGERERASRRSVSELIERAIDHSDYGGHALGLEWGERRLANVHKLMRLARRFEASEGRDLRAFLDHVAHLMEASGGAESDAPVDGVEPDAVRLMSIHAAKGLEFPVVCVADLGRAQNTRLPDLLVEGSRVGLQLVRLDGGKATPALDYESLAEERRLAEAQEEDRILYVAMTRARERLLLSGAVDFARWPEERRAAAAISWLGPALSAEVPALAGSPEAAWRDLPVGRGGGAEIRLRLNTRGTVGSVLRREALSPVPGEMPQGAGEEPPAESPQLTIAIAEQGEATRAVARVGSPARAIHTAGELSSLSYTSLTELERCGYRYYLERVLGLAEDRSAARSLGADRGPQGRARGILVHRLLESLDFARPRLPSPEDVRALARELGTSLEGGESAAIVELLEGAMRSTSAVRVAAAEEVRREYPFAFALAEEEPLVRGVIDLLFLEADGGSVVLDYKSDRVAADVDLDALVEHDYGVQRLLYALAVLREGAPRVEVVHWFLERPLETVSVSYTAEERAGLERDLLVRLGRARERGFAVSRHPHRGLCLTCPGRTSLCSWGEEATMSEQPMAAGPPVR